MEKLSRGTGRRTGRRTPERGADAPARPGRPGSAAALAALALLAGYGQVRATPAAGNASAGRAEQDTLVEKRHEGPHGARDYRLRIPREPAPEGDRSLVLMLHGCTQDAADFAAGTRMGERAAEQSWLALFPEQPAGAHPQRCWRWFEPEHQSADAGEPALLVAMLDEVIAEHGVDPARVYLAGISAGGAMAAVLAATHPDRFAAVAVHSGVPYGAARGTDEAMAALQGRGAGTEELSRRLEDALEDRPAPPLLVVHGEEDAAVASVNAVRLAATWLAAADRLAGEAGPSADRLPEPDLDERRATENLRPWRVRTWEGSGPRVELRTVEGLGHAWSGGDPAGSYTDPEGPSATQWIVEFFRRVSAGADGPGGGDPEEAGPRAGRGEGR